MIRPRAVTLDVTHTLLHCPRLGEVYSEALARHGIAAEPAEVGRLVPQVWEEFSCTVPLGGERFAAHAGGARGFWRSFAERLCAHLGVPSPTPFAAAELYDRFAQPDAWELYADVPETLSALRAAGLRLGVVSNWDERLPILLERFGLAAQFDAVVYSAAVGVEKPDPRIFRQAVAALGVAPEEVLHVGDSRREDVEGALAAGLQALLLDRSGRGRGDLATLAELPARLAGSPPDAVRRPHPVLP